MQSAGGSVLVALLVLVMPPIEIDVEYNNGSSGQTSKKVSKERKRTLNNNEIHLIRLILLLIVGQRQGSNTTVASRESVQRSQIESTPNFNDSTITSCH